MSKVKLSRFKELTEEDIQKVIDLYESTNLSLVKIANSIGYKNKDVVNKILRLNNIEKRSSVIRKYRLNEDYFIDIDNQYKAYILGFIYADGHIRKDNLVLSIVVHNKDFDILEKIRKELNSDIPIENIKDKNHSRINICSRRICNSLNNLGCHNGKTFNLIFPKIRADLIRHFIRGFMDGDGCISISNKTYGKYISLSFTGTKEMMESLKEILNIDNRITFYKNVYAFHVGKEKDVIRILDWLYADTDLYLNRKYDKYIEFKEYKFMR